MKIESKLPNVGTTIFTVMSALAEQHKALNLSQGFPNFDTPEPLKNLVNHYMQEGKNQYAPMPGLPILRQRLAEKMQKMYGCNVDPMEEITITVGGSQAIFTAITAFVKAGDEVILIEPAYDSYAPSIEVNGGKVIPYRLEAPDFKIDWDVFSTLITEKTRMIVINTPHNPTGKTLKINDLQNLEKIIERSEIPHGGTEGSDILIMSDEVYEHLIFDGQRHESILRYPNLWERSMAAFSFGKTFHATGWKMGYLVAPAHLMREFRKVHQFNVFSVNTPMQYAIADYLEDEDSYLSLPNFYQTKRDLFLNEMKNSRFVPLHSEGTYFQLFDYQHISDEKDVDFSKRLTIEHGVATIPISVFYGNGVSNAKIVRMCFAKTEETLQQAAEQLSKI
jgi:methionine transaminase